MALLRLIVEVTGAAGDPVEGAFVTVPEAPVPMPEIALVTGGDGRVPLTLPAGRVRIEARAEGRAAGAEMRLERDGAVLRIVLPPAGDGPG